MNNDKGILEYIKLSGKLRKEPYKVPVFYFENIENNVKKRLEKRKNIFILLFDRIIIEKYGYSLSVFGLLLLLFVGYFIYSVDNESVLVKRGGDNVIINNNNNKVLADSYIDYYVDNELIFDEDLLYEDYSNEE